MQYKIEDQELLELESSLISIRCQLRQLRGKYQLFNQAEHTSKVAHLRSSSDKIGRRSYQLITQALHKLDEYDDFKDMILECEGAWSRVLTLEGE